MQRDQSPECGSMEHQKTIRKRSVAHSPSLHAGRHLQRLKDSLLVTCQRLQEEKAQLLLSNHLLSSLAEVLGHYRASLQDQDALDMASPVADIERLLLEQLTVLRMPSMSLSACSTDSSAASNGSVSGCTAGGLAEISSTCTSRGNSADMSLSASFRTNSWFSSCGLLVREPSTESARSTSCSEQQHQPDQPVAPEHDPFMLARLLFEQPCDPSASHLTMAELRAKFADDVKQLQACLKQLEANTPPNGAPAQAVAAPAESCSHAGAGAGASGSNSGDWVTCAVQDARQQQQQDLSPLEAVWDVQLGMYVLTNSLLGAGRESMFFELQLTNWHTGERLQEPCRERHRAALQELQLTPAQLQRMAAGWKFFQPLMAPIISERKQLHAEGVQVHQLAAAGSGLQPSSASPALSIHSGHGAGLQAQQEQASRLRMLARKDALLRGIMALYMQGCLSLLQQAKLRVAMAPYHLNMGTLCVVMMEHIQQQELLQQKADASGGYMPAPLCCAPVQ